MVMMISPAVLLQSSGGCAPSSLAAALATGALPAQLSRFGSSSSTRIAGSSRTSSAAAVLPSSHLQFSAVRGISSGKEGDADDKMGRPTTPWVRQVISGVDLMRHPKYNKGGRWGVECGFFTAVYY